MNEFVSEYAFDDLDDKDKKDEYRKLFNALKRERRILNTITIAAEAYPHN